ncbi:hypothetical protein ACFOVU_03515 [Nocardiopsis sediminis]|uniref:Glycosyltransferase RgtA/B/C/D-like domain-containing protein n=1 Tax=Nocardiopsis sediminis TaxID=1778267 RepID=A0ABV8FJW7_9ACTN
MSDPDGARPAREPLPADPAPAATAGEPVEPDGTAPDTTADTTAAPAGALAAAVSRGVRDPVVMLGSALILASLAVKVVVLRSAYFIEDDFLFVADAAASDLTVEYLTELHKGHLMPGAKLLAYVQTAIAPYDWTLTAGVMLACQAGASAAVFRLLWVVFGRRWAILAPLVVYVFAPLTIPVLAWWSAALNAVPFQLAIALALLWTARYLRTGEARFGWQAAGAVVFGMAFSVKAMFLPPLLFVFAAAFLVRGRLPGVLWRTLDRDMPFWTGMALLSVGHGLLYLSRQDTSGGEGAGAPRGDTALSMAQRLLGETFPAGAAGGPVEWGPVTPAGGLLNPSAEVVVAAWSAIGVAVIVSLAVRRRSWRAWAILAGHLVVVDIVPTLLARGRYQDVIGYDPRYVADAALVFAVCLAFAFLPVRGEEGAYRRAWPPGAARTRAARTAAVAATTAFALVGGASTYTFADTLSGGRVRWYLDTVRGSLSEVPPEAGVYPRPVPEDIVLPWNGTRRLSSQVLSPLAEEGVAERIRDPEPAGSALVFNDAGYLVPGGPAESSAFFGPAEDEECIATADFGGQAVWPVESLGGPTLVLGIAYSSETETELHAFVGDAAESTRLPAAPDGGVWYVPLAGAGNQLMVTTDPEALCLRWVTFGELEPVTEGDPWAEEPQEGDGSAEEGPGEEEPAEDGEDIPNPVPR